MTITSKHAAPSDTAAASPATLVTAAGMPGSVEDWRALARSFQADYRAGQPWPHLAIDGLFASADIATALAEAQAAAAGLKHTRNTTFVKEESSTLPGPVSQSLVDILDGPGYAAFLEELTGIRPLIADKTHYNAGLHITPKGGRQGIHLDFRVQPETGQQHRIVTLLYCSPGWTAADGGLLELWHPSMKRSPTVVMPEAGRLVIFEAHGGTPHGLPNPVTRPEGRVALATHHSNDEVPARPKGLWAVGGRPKRPEDPWSYALPDPKEFFMAIGARAPKPVKHLIFDRFGGQTEAPAKRP
jgi:Rps23 Pro-64 3,4-dihydroxylase Tpa1-like proline 4-hydroxylase